MRARRVDVLDVTFRLMVSSQNQPAGQDEKGNTTGVWVEIVKIFPQ